MSLEKYIHHLLLDNETVIIPGFGAFISVHKPAEITNEGIKPPSKQFTFSSQIRNNDGVLVGHVSASKKISHFDALKEIEKGRDNLIYRLEKGEKVVLEQTGVLFINDKHEIEFEPLVSENLLLDSFGLGEVEIKEIVKEETPIVQEEIVEPEIILESSEKKETEIISESEIQEEETTFSEIGENENMTEEPISEPIINNDFVTEPKSVKISEVSDYSGNESAKKRGSWWYLLILIPVLIAGYFVIRNNQIYETTPEIQKENVSVTKDTSNTSTDSVLTVIPDTVKSESIDSGSVQSSSSGSKLVIKSKQKRENTGETVFYLVGGSFRSQENADKFLAELKEKGFEPFHLGKRGNFYIVGVGKFNTESEAVAARREFTEKNSGSGVWILVE